MLIGPERTPPELAIANIAVTKGIPEAVNMAAAIVMAGYVGGNAQGKDEAKPETETVH